MEIKMQQGLESHFENLVTGNIITQNQANKIKSIIHKAEVEKKADFQSSEIIDNHRHRTYMGSNRINYINSLKAFVDNGSITQAQADEIIMKQIYLCRSKG